MNESDWRILKVLVQEKSGAKTADMLFMTQPAVSYRMAKMEEEMKAKLFIRNSKGVTLTSAGERLFEYADQLLRQYQDIREHVQSRSGVISGTIRLGVSSAFAELHMPLVLKDFYKQYPAISIKMSVGISNEVMKGMYQGETLLGIVRGEQQWNQHSIFLYSDILYLISLFKYESISQLKQIPYISYRADPVLQYQIDEWLHNNFTVPPLPAINTDSPQTCVNIIKQGIGWSLLPSIRVFHCADIYKYEIHDKSGKPYLRPSYLLYTDSVTSYDTYSLLIRYIRDWVEKARTTGILWPGNEHSETEEI